MAMIITSFSIKKNLTKIIVKDDTSGRVMTVTTNQPGVVMYTANTLDEGLYLEEGQLNHI